MASPTPKLDPLQDMLYVLHHVFLPQKLPQCDDSNPANDITLCHLTYTASRKFADQILSQSQRRSWLIVSDMLERLLKTTHKLEEKILINDIQRLEDGGQFFLS